jgi:hypothetical protein
LGGFAAWTGFPLGVGLAFTATGCFAGFAEIFGLTTSAPLVTGASSCSAAFGVACTVTLKNENEAANSKRATVIALSFMFSSHLTFNASQISATVSLEEVVGKILNQCCYEA